MWEEMSYNKYNFEYDNFRIKELYKKEDIDIEYTSYELDIIEMFEEL